MLTAMSYFSVVFAKIQTETPPKNVGRCEDVGRQLECSADEVAMKGQNLSSRFATKILFSLAAGALILGLWVSAAHSQSDSNEAAVQRGRKQFQQACGFCHAQDATGARGPDLVRSPLVAHDKKGELIGEVIRSGRPDKGMPPLPATDQQIADIAAFLHARALEALQSSGVPSDYPAEKLLTGNVQAGKDFFEGAGGCKNCHSPTGDLAGIAGKYSSIELEARMLYPEGKRVSAVITLPSGEQIREPVVHYDDFVIAVRDDSGWYRSFSRRKAKVELQDPLEAHRKLLDKLTQADVHNLFAYVYSLK
jgi:cytochrome c oxidase cbb3-type subunit III